VVQHEDKWCRYVLSGFQRGLRLEISVERLHAAFEPRSVMLRAENLDLLDVVHFSHSSGASSLTIATNGVLQSFVGRPRLDERLDERVAIPHR